MRRRLFIATAAAIAAVLVGGAAIAATPAGGTGRNTVSIVSLTGNIGGTTQVVGVGTGFGYATNDPARNSLSHNSAVIQVAMASGSGAVPVDSTPFVVQANAECNRCSASSSDGASAETMSITTPSDVVAGTVEIGSRRAEAGPAHALSTLSQVKVGANVMQGLVGLEGVKVDLGDSADSTKAHAIQGLSIDAVRVFSITALLGQLGKTMDDLSLSGLIALADSVLPAGTTDPIRNALADFEAAEEDEAALNQAVADLADLDPSNDGAALVVIAQLGQKYLNDPVAGPEAIALAIAATKTLVQAAIDVARDELEGTVGALPLLTVRNLVTGVTAEANAAAATATAGVSWDSIAVAGIAVPPAPEVSATVNAAADRVEAVVDLIAAALGQDLDVSIEFAREDEIVTTDGPYRVAEGRITALSLEVRFNPSVQGVSQNLGAAVKVLGLTARAEFRGATSDPGGPGLATTGAAEWIPLAGLVMLAAALGLRRSAAVAR